MNNITGLGYNRVNSNYLDASSTNSNKSDASSDAQQLSQIIQKNALFLEELSKRLSGHTEMTTLTICKKELDLIEIILINKKHNLHPQKKHNLHPKKKHDLPHITTDFIFRRLDAEDDELLKKLYEIFGEDVGSFTYYRNNNKFISRYITAMLHLKDFLKIILKDNSNDIYDYKHLELFSKANHTPFKIQPEYLDDVLINITLKPNGWDEGNILANLFPELKITLHNTDQNEAQRVQIDKQKNLQYLNAKRG